ncbi:MAG: ParA family protein [Acidimicrobiia bacterium]|nr:ParA family protein [Acidimicrobiia bacterium]
MLVALSSTKGGVGCSVTSAALGLIAAERRSTLLVDLGGDLPTILGVDGSIDGAGRGAAAGVLDWLATERPPADALGRLEVAAGPRLTVLPLGTRPGNESADAHPPAADRLDLLAAVLAGEQRVVVVDVGNAAERFAPLLDRADVSIHVSRSCYLALRRRPLRRRSDRVVLIRELGRALRPVDVAAAIGAPVSVTVDWDPAVARAVDAGLLPARLPRSLRPLRSLLAGSDGRLAASGGKQT